MLATEQAAAGSDAKSVGGIAPTLIGEYMKKSDRQLSLDLRPAAGHGGRREGQFKVQIVQYRDEDEFPWLPFVAAIGSVHA